MNARFIPFAELRILTIWFRVSECGMARPTEPRTASPTYNKLAVVDIVLDVVGV